MAALHQGTHSKLLAWLYSGNLVVCDNTWWGGDVYLVDDCDGDICYDDAVAVDDDDDDDYLVRVA